MKVQNVLNSFIEIFKNYLKNLSSFRDGDSVTVYNNFIIYLGKCIGHQYIFFSSSASFHQ